MRFIDKNVVLEYLAANARGKAHAIKRADLAARLGVSIREIKHCAEELRIEGHPVGYSTDAETGGIFLASTPEEVGEIVNKIRRLAMSILREYSAVKRAQFKAEVKVAQKELFG